MTRKNKYLLAVLWSLCFGASYAQEYRVKASLNPVPATGFYKIPVTAELTAHAKADLSDIRILTDSTQVPYINGKELTRVYKKEAFTEFPVISNNTDNKHTTIILKNPSSKGVTQLSVIMNNTMVNRYTSLSGSDDNNHWFIINDSLHFYGSPATDQGNYIQTLYLPLCAYKYFRLSINNAGSDPLKIIGAGILANSDSSTLPAYVMNPAFTVSQKNDDKTSQVIISGKTSYLVDSVLLNVTGPKFYDRQVKLYVGEDYIIDSAKMTDENVYPASPDATFTLSSASTASFRVNGLKTGKLILEISNKDNPPLKVTGATTYQRQQYLVCWLEKGKSYILVAGNPAAVAPDYDLSHFKNDIPASLPILTYGEFSGKVFVCPGPPESNNKWLWPTIIIAVIVLSFLTYRLMREMKHSEK